MKSEIEKIKSELNATNQLLREFSHRYNSAVKKIEDMDKPQTWRCSTNKPDLRGGSDTESVIVLLWIHGHTVPKAGWWSWKENEWKAFDMSGFLIVTHWCYFEKP